MAGIVAMAALAAGLAAPAGAHHHAPIQPGAEMVAPYGCTMNFVFTDAAGRLYIGTAGHCVDNEGQAVRVAGLPGPIGTVAWLSSGADFALVAISPTLHGSVDPSVRHWGGPTGVAPPGLLGGVVYHYGFGVLYGSSELTRPRAGELTLMNDEYFLAQTTAVPGDSGSPVIRADGAAVGVVSEFAFGQLHTDRGPTVGYILQRAQAEKGLTLSLVTAPLEPAVGRTVAQAEHLTGLDV